MCPRGLLSGEVTIGLGKNCQLTGFYQSMDIVLKIVKYVKYCPQNSKYGYYPQNFLC